MVGHSRAKFQIVFAPDQNRRDHKSKAIDMLTELIEKGALNQTIDAMLDPPETDEPPTFTNCHNIATSLMCDLYIYPSKGSIPERFSRKGWKIVSGYNFKEDGSRWDHSWLECGHYAIDASGVYQVPDGQPSVLYIFVMDKWIYRKQLNLTITSEYDDSAFIHWLQRGKAKL